MKQIKEKILLIVVLVSIVEVFCRLMIFDPTYFPKPSDIGIRAFQLFFDLNFQKDIYWSSFRITIGMFLSIVIVIPIFIFSCYSEKFLYGIELLFGLILPLPKSAVFPFLLLLFGLGQLPHIILIFIGSFNLLLLNLVVGLKRLKSSGYLPLAHALKIKGYKLFKKVIFPGIIPEFLTGLKLSFASSLVLLIVSEMAMTRKGLGVFLWSSWDQFKIIDMYVILYLLSFIGLFFFMVCDLLQEIYLINNKESF